MVPPRRQRLSQNFLWNRQLVERLVRSSSISSKDLVLEIGPGRGILTQALLQAAARVAAVEIDEKLYRSLRQKFGHYTNLVLIPGDCLAMHLPREPYKVFSNIPFGITGEIIRKLLQSDDAPADCYLLVQQEAAAKFLPSNQHNSLAALLYYPWWDMRITHCFQRADFIPPPGVDSVLLQITRRETPLLDLRQKAIYQDYLAARFGRDKHAKELAPDRFLAAFQSFADRAKPQQLRVIRGVFSKLQEQQRHLQKIHRTRTDPTWKKLGRK